MDQPGEVIDGRYVLVEVVGSGGMATVWRALGYGVGGAQATVAIKRIKETIAHDLGFVELFVEEARVYTHLVHPNIVQIHDFGEDPPGRYYLAMEWIDGLSLAQYLQAMLEIDRLPPWPVVGAIAFESLAGLAGAHDRIDAHGMRRPVYHRDVTPQNILLGKDGAVKLTDFGLARAMDRASITEPNVIKGKVGYLAPEMTEAVHPTPQTDMYALGVVMWQALTGQRLFDGKDEVEIFLAAKRGEVPPVLEIRPDVPQALGAVIDRSLAYDPRDRFESAQQMQRVLGGVLRGLGAIVEREELARSVRMICSFRHEGELPREV